MGCQQHTDDMELPNLNQCQKTEQRGKIRQDRKSFDEQNVLQPNAQEMKLEDLMYIPNNQQPLVCPAVPDQHGREQTKETTEPEGALEVPTSLNTDSASAPQNYDTQKDSEQVLQEGTEAITEGKPGLRPSELLQWYSSNV